MTNSSKRLAKFKADLIKEIPLFPNNKETKSALESESISGVLLAYLNWKSRQIRPRERKTILSANVTSDRQWKNYRNQIKGILKKSENGEDLNPYLSLEVHNKGYTIKKNGVNAWSDKDQILNTKGLYHFHLSHTKMPKGHMDRTNELLFAYVTRDTFQTLGIFTHDAFSQVGKDGDMHPERERLYRCHDLAMNATMEPGSVYLQNPIMSSGHTLNVVHLVQHYTFWIEEYNSKFDDYEFLTLLYRDAVPKKHKLTWAIYFTELGIYDATSDTFFGFGFSLN